MLILDGAPILEVRGDLLVGSIVEEQSSQCPDVRIGGTNVADKIFETHSQIADFVEQEQEQEAISFGVHVWSTIRA